MRFIFLSLLILTSCGGEVNTRFEVVDVPVGDQYCALGGTKSTEYIDSNSNGQLDSDEIRGTSTYSCVQPEEEATQ